MSCTNANVLAVGAMFSSFEQLDSAIRAYSSREYVQFYIRDSRSVELGARKLLRPLSANIKYYQITYWCIRGGKKPISRARFRLSSTLLVNCPAHIRARASACGMKLEIVSFGDKHNHEVSEKIFRSLPQQRRLPINVQKTVQELMNLKANRRLIKEKVESETGKIVLFKDLSNIAARGKKRANNDSDECVEILETKHENDSPQDSKFNIEAVETLIQEHPPENDSIMFRVTPLIIQEPPKNINISPVMPVPNSPSPESDVPDLSEDSYKRKRNTLMNKSEELIGLACNFFKNKDDQFDFVGKNVAAKLRDMNPQQRVIAEKLISEILFHGQLELLTPDASLNYTVVYRTEAVE